MVSLLLTKEMYPFKKIRLNDCGKDVSKRWYIEFYAWDIQQNKLLRKRFYEINIFTGLDVTYMRSIMVEFNGRELDSITVQEINNYILKLIRTKRISPSQQNQRINAIKFYYEKVAGLEKQLYHLE